MLLYHCNFGYPLLDENAILETPHTRIEPRDAEAAEGLAQACRFEPPSNGYREKVYFHHLKADRKGLITARLTNAKRGLSVIIRYRYDQLPYFTQWKMMGKGEYVCGLEPGNALVLGRAAERQAGRLTTLKPGETRQYEILFQVEAHNGETA
jgi:galactose mutarotase-like enzyme